MVLQGMEGGVPLKKILALHQEYTGGFFPNQTSILFFPDYKFDDTFKRRQKWSEKTSVERSRTVWDEGRIDIQKRRQAYYLKLPDIYRKLKVPRRFAAIDASVRPEQVVIQVLGALTPSIEEEFGRKAVEELIPAFRRLKNSGHFVQINDAWEKQQKLKI